LASEFEAVDGKTIASGERTWKVMMKNNAENDVTNYRGRTPDLQGRNQPTTRVAMTPNSSTFSATHPPTQASSTTIDQSPKPTHFPAFCLSPRSTPIARSTVSRARRIHMLLLPKTTAHMSIRATSTQASSAGKRAKTPEGVIGVAVCNGSGRDGSK